ncbi:protein FAR1-RELATED SEQUENCE 5-like [Arachis stenosperma]|uniref:protein FAR1-RELATED SEQUENCE 5-like n=1 Tax=Arachis stenosperma TaxID=217475 RepID=UPI0025ACFBCA|nr:protein FAR1-RELATED SEQUENCE 5-like [Arachis stenosperma]
MYVMLDREKKSWIVSRSELRHSHPCLAKKVVHSHEYRDLTMHAKCVITDNDEAGIRPNKTYLALANEVGRSSNLSFLEKNVRNYITRTLRCADDNADFKEMMNYFVRIKEINPNFFYAIDVDDANMFRSALWVDARCRASYEYYEDVVSFDTTYRRNRYGELNAKMNHIVHNSPSADSFKVDWAEFIKEFDLGQNRWLTDLYANRRKWVPIFFKSEFWARMRSTQRSESMHAFYGGFLLCKSGLVQFVHEYDNVFKNKE